MFIHHTPSFNLCYQHRLIFFLNFITSNQVSTCINVSVLLEINCFLNQFASHCFNYLLRPIINTLLKVSTDLKQVPILHSTFETQFAHCFQCHSDKGLTIPNRWCITSSLNQLHNQGKI